MPILPIAYYIHERPQVPKYQLMGKKITTSLKTVGSIDRWIITGRDLLAFIHEIVLVDHVYKKVRGCDRAALYAVRYISQTKNLSTPPQNRIY